VRGRERNRSHVTILDEISRLVDDQSQETKQEEGSRTGGVKEIVLLGQNVNSYHDKTPNSMLSYPTSSYELSNQGFRNTFRKRGGSGMRFVDLLERISHQFPQLRIRFLFISF